MGDLFDKDTFKIVATDSGLGGMAVAANLVSRLTALRAFRKAEVVFFNCRPSESLGYDMMKSHDRRIRVFSNALEAMNRTLQPDAILVACNTLSVLRDRATFTNSPGHPPIIGIVELGVSMIARHLSQDPNASIIMFAAPTTVQSGVHMQSLTAMGFDPGRLAYRDCEDLPTAIERGLEDGHTRSLVEHLVAESVKNAGHRSAHLVGALLCTHFGFAEELFKTAFKKNGIDTDHIIDPTPRMAEAFLEHATADRFKSSEVGLSVVSHTRLPADIVQSMSGMLELSSPAAASSLRNYTLSTNLFDTDGSMP